MKNTVDKASLIASLYFFPVNCILNGNQSNDLHFPWLYFFRQLTFSPLNIKNAHLITNEHFFNNFLNHTIVDADARIDPSVFEFTTDLTDMLCDILRWYVF